MDQPETVQMTSAVTLSATTTVTEQGVRTVYHVQAVDVPTANWTSEDLDQCIEWTRGFLGARRI